MLGLAGCPRKLKETKTVEVNVPRVCPPAKAPEPPVKELALVAVVRSGGGRLAVLAAASGFGKVVAEKGQVGREHATVTAISDDTMTAITPTGDVITRRVATELVAPTPTTPARTPPVKEVPKADEKALTAWRESVLDYVSLGFGVPADALLAVAVAGSTHRSAPMAKVLNALGWAAVNDIDQILVTRLQATDAKVLLDGVAPNQAAYDGFVGRLRQASPLIARVKPINAAQGPAGLQFQLSLDVPLVSAETLARKAGGADAGPMSKDTLRALDSRAKRLPRDPRLTGFDARLKAWATEAGLKVSRVARLGTDVVDGYLGMVTYEIEASGDLQALLVFLSVLRDEKTNKHPVVVDPLTMEPGRIKLSVRVPWVAGKAESRSPAPAPIALPRLPGEHAWRSAYAAGVVDALRDPFKK